MARGQSDTKAVNVQCGSAGMLAVNINKRVYRYLSGILLTGTLSVSPLVGHLSDTEAQSVKHPVRTVQAPFLSHRIVYSMSLGRSSAGATVQSATGQMFYRFQEGCADWEVETRVFLRLTHGMHDATEDVETTWSYESAEDFGGDRFNFEVEHKHNGDVIEGLVGNAWRTVRGVTAVYDTDHQDVHMPTTALFPTAHLVSVLDRARAGETHLSDIVFDGAGQQNPYRVNVFVVGRVQIEGDNPSEGLEEMPVWRVRLAYFSYESPADVPDFEIEVDFREDGVAQRIIQDFGDFQLNLTPVQFEELPPKGCK